MFDLCKKPTHSGRYLNFLSNHPLCHKRGIIFSLIDRIIYVSHPNYHTLNISNMINTLLNNGYPLDFLFNTINNRIRSFIHNKKLNQTNHKDLIDNNIKIYCTLPYVREKNLTEKFHNVYRNYNLNIAYKPVNSLNKFIKTGKDRLDKMDNNNVVYKISCCDCDCSYVGQTKRKLKTRIKEHKSDIRKSNNHSVVSLHQLEYGHQIDWDNINILDSEHSFYKRSISEMIHIKTREMALTIRMIQTNYQTSIYLLFIFFLILFCSFSFYSYF
ncbi:hypothetical protein ALC57_18593 [Trachymyrmex cornetzi]|uniref:GIY-YIG domain-containing protein n=1 Tax=Trachymyrmex cornetzi TaxID=471704 RepID=A0A151IRJ5_9HYME|nr:hypothetical protein ALC57_18593 [Trachymyrmex cornetzi]